jgi:chitin synthase
MRKLAFFLQLLYTVFNLLFSWFGLANFFLAFDFLLTTMANPKIDPFGGASQLIHTVLQYAYAIIMLTVLISCLGNRPQGAAWVYAFIMLFFAVLAGYLMFAAVWLTIRGVEFVVREVNRDKDVSTASVLFGNDTFRDIVLALGSTYGTYIISAILYLDPWHMVTSFVQYIFLVPSFINVLQMYAFCNTHDVSWGTKAFWKPPTKDVATTLTPQPGDEELSVAVTVPQDL